MKIKRYETKIKKGDIYSIELQDKTIVKVDASGNEILFTFESDDGILKLSKLRKIVNS